MATSRFIGFTPGLGDLPAATSSAPPTACESLPRSRGPPAHSSGASPVNSLAAHSRLHGRGCTRSLHHGRIAWRLGNEHHADAWARPAFGPSAPLHSPSRWPSPMHSTLARWQYTLPRAPSL